jgi:hypothetical protein
MREVSWDISGIVIRAPLAHFNMKTKIIAIILRPLTLVRRLMKKSLRRSASIEAPQSEKLIRRPFL